MEKQFPSPGETRTGGTTVILGWLRNCGRPLPKPTRQRNPIPDLKNECFDFYKHSFSRVQTLIAPRNPSGRRKSFSNMGGTRFRSCGENTTGNGRKIDAFVMTSHLLLANERRNRAFLLPIRLPNPSFLRSKAQRTMQEGAGGQPGAARQNCSIENLVRKFCPNGRISHSYEY
jgi:hypothetical protein